MSVDTTTQAALEERVLYWRALLYADFDGDPLRATSAIYGKTVSGSGDAELDGYYESYAHKIMEVGAVKHNETGSDTVTIQMSGLVVNTDLLAIIGDKTKWQGRTARLWFYVADENEVQVGQIIPYYTGYMNDVVIAGSPKEQRITLTVENYLATLSGAPDQTYMMQKLFDSGDLSASATLGAANGMGAGSGVTDLTGAGAGFSLLDRGKVYHA